MRRKLGLCLILIVTSLIITSCKNEVAFDWDKDELIVGLECGYPPYNWIEQEATITNYVISNHSNAYAEGYDVQIAKLVAAELGLKLVIREVEWEKLITELNNGQIDCIIAGMSPRPDRLQSIDFTNPYYINKHVILLAKSSPYAAATSINDFAGIKVAGQRETVYDTLAGQLAIKAAGTHENAESTVAEVINAIKMGQLDATVVEEVVAVDAVNESDNLTYIYLEGIFEVSEEDCAVSIGVRKVDKELATKINEALAKITETQRTEMMNKAMNKK